MIRGALIVSLAVAAAGATSQDGNITAGIARRWNEDGRTLSRSDIHRAGKGVGHRLRLPGLAFYTATVSVGRFDVTTGVMPLQGEVTLGDG